MKPAIAFAAALVAGLGTLSIIPTADAVDPAPATSYTGWVQREEGAAPGSETSYELAGADAVLYSSTGFGRVVGIYNDSTGVRMSARFPAPPGETLQAGRTYFADVTDQVAGSYESGFAVFRDGQVCGTTSDELATQTIYPEPAPATGWFHISELAYDAHGMVTRFAATYEINCQFVGGPAGFEGSVALNSLQPPVPLPDAPVPPGSVTALHALNVGPNTSSINTTTLTWSNPADVKDVTVDMVEATDAATIPALLGTHENRLYRGRGTRYFGDMLDGFASRSYRVVARGSTGRLGPPSYLTVTGVRTLLPTQDQRVTIGQQAEIAGRMLSVPDLYADFRRGPGLAEHTVTLCQQARAPYVDGECNRIDQTTTSSDGSFTLSATPRENSIYYIVVPATSTSLGDISSVLYARVAPRTDLRAPESTTSRSIAARGAVVSRVNARTRVRRGSVIHFTTLRARAGSRGVIHLQRLDGKRWHTVTTARLGAGAGTRRLALPYRENTRGLHAYRVVKLADAHHVNGYSRTVYVEVR